MHNAGSSAVRWPMNTRAVDIIAGVITRERERRPERPILIGVSGAQGSGKSYHCRSLAATNPRVAHFSLDDVYLTRAERERLAAEVSPLFATRGPPGTHDLELAHRTIASLKQPGPTPVPRFDKSSDDRAPVAAWPRFDGPAETILVDGWCVGALPPAGTPPLNAVEQEDHDGRWRAAIDAALRGPYANFFSAFDAMILLQAPSWEIVRRWRGQQEEETLGRPLTREEDAKLDRFVMHYERITRSMLAGNHIARCVAHLDEARNVVRVEEK
jgi:D-glycerate 3-kinase